MKRILFVLLLSLLMLNTVSVMADVSDDPKCFQIEGTTLTGINNDLEGCSRADLVIPNTVTEIKCGFPDTYATITVPDSVKTITAFNHDSTATTIIASSNSAMARWAAQQENADTLYIRLVDPKAGDFTIVGDVLTAYNGNAETVVIPANVKRISGYAFNPTKKLRIKYTDSIATYRTCTAKKVVLPDGLIDIGYSAFGGCGLLETINFPESLLRIGSYAFMNDVLLGSIKLPSSLQSLGIWTFYNLPKLKEIEIPESIQNVGAAAFGEQEYFFLEKIYLPRAVKIDDEAHTYWWLDIERLEIPENTTIYAWRGSDAAKWALENNRPLIYRDDIVSTQGDLDGDGVVTMDDLIDMIHVLLNDPVSIAGNADLDGDGAVTMDDLITMIHILLGDPA